MMGRDKLSSLYGKRSQVIIWCLCMYSELTISDSTNNDLHLGGTPGNTLLAYIFVDLLIITFGLSAYQPQLFLSLS